MNLIDIILIAFALSIDACVVSFTYGINQKSKILKSALSLAIFTGFFQGFMPYLGGICTNFIQSIIEPYTKWIVFVIFLYLGINFIKGAFKKKKNVQKLSFPILLLIAIATSIDAFSAGIPLSLKCDCICFPAILISLITFINSLIGFYTGRIFKKFNPQLLNIIGGLILIILAIKVAF